MINFNTQLDGLQGSIRPFKRKFARMKSKIFFLLVAVIASTGCTKDILNLSPQTERNAVDFFKTPEDFNNAVIGNYAALKLGGIYNSTGSLIWMGEVSTDNTDLGATRQAINVDNYQFIDHNYTSLNSIVYAAWRDHYIGISRSNAILEQIENADINADLKSQYSGEAHFLRGLFYFNLVRLFGNVPLVAKPITTSKGADDLIQATSEEVYQFIIEDLKSAAQKLPLQYNAASAGRATQGAAKALLGKVYLTRKEYDKAATILKEMISANNYQLLSKYADVFSYATPTNAEIIFNVQYKSGNIGQGSNFWVAFAPWNSRTEVLGPNGGTGGGINRPTVDLVNSFEPGDLRKNFSIQTAYTDLNGRIINERFVTKYKQYGALPDNSDVDFPVLRYADVLLMYAEAVNEIGFNAEAVGYVNDVRARAGLPKTTATDQSSLRLAIENERRWEFVFESQRWFDLVRTGRYVEIMKSKNLNVNDFNILFVIPQREIDLNPSLIQNRGY